MKPGTVPAKHAWSIMAGALIVVAGTAAATFGGSSLVNGLVFIVGAFLSTYLTKATKTLAFGVWFLGSILCALVVFFVTMKSATHATGLATSAAHLSGNATAETVADGVDTAAAVAGGIGGALFGVLSFFVALIASTIGLIIGAVARPKTEEAPAPVPST